MNYNMRKEEEVLALLLYVAETDERIRAVFLNGSRANPRIPKDKFQDFDIVYLVRQMDSFLKDHSWIDVFGERIILQMPGQMALEELNTSNGPFSYLMLMKDGNRIDLTLHPFDKSEEEFEPDSLAVLLLDKDHLFSSLPASNESDYLIEKPSEKMFADCCNEFWWVCTYVAKGLWRQEISYAKDMLENPVRKMFLKQIKWSIGIETNFSVSFGKSGKDMQARLSPVLYEKILSTYPDANIENIWKSLFILTEIFSELAYKVSVELGFTYNREEEYNVTDYLKWVYSLTNGK